MDHSMIDKLEQKIVNLVNAFERVRDENDQLRNQQALLNKQQQHLEALNHKAAEKLKNIVHNIKAMEQ